jgi:DNA-binding GntR family transcriptional regulator
MTTQGEVMAGLFMDKDMSDEEQVRAFILNSIITHVLGPGQRVDVDLWVEAMRVSRADVYAAIAKLQDLGVIAQSDPQFATLSEFTPEQAAEEADLWLRAQHDAFHSLYAVAKQETTDLLALMASQYDSCPATVRDVFAFAFFQIIRDAATDPEKRLIADNHAYLMELARPALELPDRFDRDLHHALVDALTYADDSLCHRAFETHAAAFRARLGRPALPPAS